jgi:hypothetical protein
MRGSLPLTIAFALGLTACNRAEAPAGTDTNAASESPVITPSPASSTAPATPPADATATTAVVPSPTATARAEEPASGDDCGANLVTARWLNALPTADVKSSIAKAVGERPIRYYGQGDAITMDFSPQRLNVELGNDGRIKLFRCG